MRMFSLIALNGERHTHTMTTQMTAKKKKPMKIFDLKSRNIFFSGYHGNKKGILNLSIRKNIDNRLLTLGEKGYV